MIEYLVFLYVKFLSIIVKLILNCNKNLNSCAFRIISYCNKKLK